MQDFVDKGIHELASGAFGLQYMYSKNDASVWEKVDEYANWNGKYPVRDGMEDTQLPNIAIVDSSGFIVPCTFVNMGDYGGTGVVGMLAGSTTVVTNGMLAKCDIIIERLTEATAKSRFYFNMTLSEFTAEDSGA